MKKREEKGDIYDKYVKGMKKVTATVLIVKD